MVYTAVLLLFIFIYFEVFFFFFVIQGYLNYEMPSIRMP